MRFRKMLVGGALVVTPWLTGCSDPGSLEVGDEMPELAWEGYVNEGAEGLSTEQPFADYGTSEMKASGKRYALLHTAADF